MFDETDFPSEVGSGPNNNETWERLRAATQQAVEEDLRKRLEINPIPSQQELDMGAFVEQLEPQTRNALATINQKGYTTDTSGYWGDHGEYQRVDGWFVIDGETQQKLRDEGYGIEVRHFKPAKYPGTDYVYPGLSKIWFHPSLPEESENSATQLQGELEGRWNRMAEILPDLGAPAMPSQTVGAIQFRVEHADSGNNGMTKPTDS